MLVTDTSWADDNPVMRNLAESYRAWHCVAWTDETLNFWVMAPRDPRDDRYVPVGWLVSGPEALLEAAADLQADGSIAVYVLDDHEADGAVGLRRVTGLWCEREPAGGVPAYWYATDAGELKPCARPQLPPQSRLERVSELVSDRRVCGGS